MKVYRTLHRRFPLNFSYYICFRDKKTYVFTDVVTIIYNTEDFILNYFDICPN